MTEFWVRKMRTYFDRIDFDKDGVITRSDFEGMADRFIESERLDPGRGKELKDKLIQVKRSPLAVAALGRLASGGGSVLVATSKQGGQLFFINLHAGVLLIRMSVLKHEGHRPLERSGFPFSQPRSRSPHAEA